MFYKLLVLYMTLPVWCVEGRPSPKAKIDSENDDFRHLPVQSINFTFTGTATANPTRTVIVRNIADFMMARLFVKYLHKLV